MAIFFAYLFQHEIIQIKTKFHLDFYYYHKPKQKFSAAMTVYNLVFSISEQKEQNFNF